jgi:hypothetical protein
MCLSTCAREALIRGFDVLIDPEATGARDLEDELLGRQTADEVRRSTLLHLTNMGARMVRRGRAGAPAALTLPGQREAGESAAQPRA